MQSGLQGFYDPAPACTKSLRVRYTFGGRTHYCEVPDYKPVVLPLGGKQTRDMPVLIVDKSFLSRRRGDGNLDHLVKPVL
jgi:hypothetical protein